MDGQHVVAAQTRGPGTRQCRDDATFQLHQGIGGIVGIDVVGIVRAPPPDAGCGSRCGKAGGSPGRRRGPGCTAPSWRIASRLRRCCVVPMRPVAPCRIIPNRRSVIVVLSSTPRCATYAPLERFRPGLATANRLRGLPPRMMHPLSSPCSDQRDHALVALSVRIGCVCIDRRTPRRSMLYPNRPRFRI